MCRVGKRCKNSNDPQKRAECNARRRAKYQSQKAQKAQDGREPAEQVSSPLKAHQAPLKAVHEAPGAHNGFDDIDTKKLASNLYEINRSGDMYFVPESLKIRSMSNTVVVNMKSFDDTAYEFHLSKSETGGMVAFESYGDDEEEITKARPFVKVSYSEMQREGYFAGKDESEVMSLNMLDMVERMESPNTNWNKDEDAAGFLYFGEAHYDINSALRNNSYINPELVKTLDGLMQKDTLEKDTVVYRGIRGKDQLMASINSGDYRDNGYLSTTTDPAIAKGFSGGGRSSSAVLKLTLPAGTKCHDASNDAEREITLPRGYDLSQGSWEFFD